MYLNWQTEYIRLLSPLEVGPRKKTWLFLPIFQLGHLSSASRLTLLALLVFGPWAPCFLTTGYTGTPVWWLHNLHKLILQPVPGLMMVWFKIFSYKMMQKWHGFAKNHQSCFFPQASGMWYRPLNKKLQFLVNVTTRVDNRYHVIRYDEASCTCDLEYLHPRMGLLGHNLMVKLKGICNDYGVCFSGTSRSTLPFSENSEPLQLLNGSSSGPEDTELYGKGLTFL